MLKGALAAAVTPLRDAGEALDEDAIGPYVGFLAAGGLDGLLALGTTGEGFLLPQEQERRGGGSHSAGTAFKLNTDGSAYTVIWNFESKDGNSPSLLMQGLDGALYGTTQAGGAVMAPPYFTLDEVELFGHFVAAARACAPVPFYVYEFAARSGYPVPVSVLERLREAAPNFRGLKVSDTPWDRFAPYLIEGLDIFVGPEALIPRGFAGGAAGAVSALASAFPELVVAAVRDPAAADLGPVRTAMERFPFQAAAKVVLARRGVPIGPDVRRPL